MQESENEVDYYKLAEQRLPRAWYEWDYFPSLSPLTFATGLTIWAFCIDKAISLELYPFLIIPHIVSGFSYHFTNKLDIDSTVMHFDATERARSEGVNYRVVEENELLSEVKSSDEFLNHPNLKGATMAQQIVSIIIPGYGIGASISKTIQAFSNFRLAKRMNLAADLARENNFS